MSTVRFRGILVPMHHVAARFLAVTLMAIPAATRATTFYVATTGASAGPGTDWSTAFHTIQSAVNAATTPGDRIWVSNGVYATGGAVAPGGLFSNRVVITNGLVVQSVAGPDATTIQASGTPGANAMRGVYLASGCTLAGFTITGGTTDTNNNIASGGGGIWCESVSALVSNCIVRDNASMNLGGGICGGKVVNTRIIRNDAPWGGATFRSDLYNCLVVENNASTSPRWSFCGSAGSEYGTLYNCTVVSNRSNSVSWDGGVSQATAYNTIIYANTPIRHTATLRFCCVQTDQSRPNLPDNCTTNNPRFVNMSLGDYRLMPSSPCRDTGTNQSWMVLAGDLAGNPRAMNGRADMGAFEFDTGERYPPVDTDADGLSDADERALGTDPGNPDTDSDGLRDGAEMEAGTSPTNRLDVFGIRTVQSEDALVVGWNSVTARYYHVFSLTNLAGLWSNVSHTIGDGSYQTFTNPPSDGPLYFRLRVTTNWP